MLAFVVLVSALLAIASSSKTPVATCCPPGSFLAIEDWQESRQLSNGLWVEAITSNYMEECQITSPMWSFLRRSKDSNATRSDHRKVHRYGRHNFILGVSCVPDKNNLQPIDGLRGSSYPDPPYFASVQDKMLGLETRSKPLADNQILQRTGVGLPSCPGGPNELATIILGDGRSSGFGNTSAAGRSYGTSPLLRINDDGQLVGKHLDFFGSTDWLRLGMPLPRRFKENQSLPVVEETELGVDFCLTWSADPRTRLVPFDPTVRNAKAPQAELDYSSDYDEEFIQNGPIHLLEAVYCDPCKAKVLCSFLTRNFLPTMAAIFDPVFWGPDLGWGPGLRGGDWWIALWPSYLDADRDGKSSIQEFYDVKVVQVLKIIFDGLDVNDDGLVKKNEARLENFFRPVFLRSIAEEFFDYLDKNNDNQISVADITRCEPLKNTSFCLHMNPLENKTVDNCHLLGSPLDHVCATLMTTYFTPDFEMIDAIQVNEKELEGTILRIFQFLAAKPGKTEIGLEEIVDGFAQLGEPPQVVDSLRQLLTPIVNTFPRMILQPLVSSADKNLDGAMDWKEFEGFGDFEVVFKRWPHMWNILQDDMLAGISRNCYPLPWTTEDLKRYFSKSEVIIRLIHNLFFHEDFQFGFVPFPM